MVDRFFPSKKMNHQNDNLFWLLGEKKDTWGRLVVPLLAFSDGMRFDAKYLWRNLYYSDKKIRVATLIDTNANTFELGEFYTGGKMVLLSSKDKNKNMRFLFRLLSLILWDEGDGLILRSVKRNLMMMRMFFPLGGNV
jgi:hypothetical protein